jgi:hypothetical protein
LGEIRQAAPFGPVRTRSGKNKPKKEATAMKTKTSKQPKQSKPTVPLKDLKPKKNPKGGGGVTEIKQG